MYVASPEGLTGKSAVALGLLDALVREVGSVGVFRPLTAAGGREPGPPQAVVNRRPPPAVMNRVPLPAVRNRAVT